MAVQGRTLRLLKPLSQRSNSRPLAAEAPRGSVQIKLRRENSSEKIRGITGFTQIHVVARIEA